MWKKVVEGLRLWKSIEVVWKKVVVWKCNKNTNK